MSDSQMEIHIIEGGPYKVSGSVPLYEDAIMKEEGAAQESYMRAQEYETKETYELCRCGQSSHKPFCDGTHHKIGFEGTEVASKEPYAERADIYRGEGVNLLDDNRCAYARFCHVRGKDVWTLTEESGFSDELKRDAIAGAWLCPTGRLESHDASTGKVYEQDFEPSIVILEDVAQGASGPYFVRGNIPLYGADGEQYEPRNRYALCRCGNSRDIPFCDAMHINIEFDDESRALEGHVKGRDDSFINIPNDKDLQ